MNTTEPQPDPSPAPREELYLTAEGALCLLSDPVREIAVMSLQQAKKGMRDIKADAQRLVNGWNALPALELCERALQNMVDMYVRLVNSGDAGNWDPETEPEIIQSRAALTVVRESKGE